MTNQVLMEKHKPCYMKGVIGCGGYANTKSIVCMTANGDNNFVDEGIVENSILFVTTILKCVLKAIFLKRFFEKKHLNLRSD